MRASKLYLHTLKEVPSEIEKISDKLLIRGSMMRKVGGTYAYLPLGYRVIEKVKTVFKKKLEEEGVQEFNILLPSDEKTYASLVKKDLKSYKELPFGFYQVKVGADEVDKKGSISFELITFDKDKEGVEAHFQYIHTIFEEIFKKCGLSVEKILDIHNKKEITSGKFMIFSEEGKEEIALCKSCGYKALKKRAMCGMDLANEEKEMKALEEVYTPNVKTIEQLNEFLDIEEAKLMKCLLLKGKDQFIAAFVRGDRELNLAKLETVLNVEPMTLSFAEGEDVERITSAKTGFAGPIGLKDVVIVVDAEVTKMKNAVAGANKTDYHIKNVNYKRDFKADVIADIIMIQEGDKCPKCDGHIEIQKGIELGRLKKLNTNYSKHVGTTYIDEDGKEKNVFMGSYSLHVTKTLAAIVDKYHDDHGILWPVSVAPFHVIISIVNKKKEEQLSLGERLYKELVDAGIEVLLDDRDERAGAKFKDADLLGIPIRIVVGKKAGEGVVEYKLRNEEEKEELSYNKALSNVLKTLKEAGIK
ncbi:proline--tRNA ligase [Crassaminicella profunda]|uniref:proline--tRNA ligase n=1 Tax=Crassaminicella profunda TaxID=1286698 RepID=UPI001CA64E7C|nr:proline--tRNA ligase [Crassaminicella profunda]QZY54655.1 proline--tRNA ligase [Crassaminicella profunda]